MVSADFLSSAGITPQKLVVNPISHAEIISRAERVSMEVRERKIFSPLNELMSLTPVIASEDISKLSLASESSSAERCKDLNVDALIKAHRSDEGLEFEIFFDRPCGEAILNRKISYLIANCILHVDHSALTSDAAYFDCSPNTLDRGLRHQAKLFSLGFRYPSPLVNEYVNSNIMTMSQFASLIGGSSGELFEYLDPALNRDLALDIAA